MICTSRKNATRGASFKESHVKVRTYSKISGSKQTIGSMSVGQKIVSMLITNDASFSFHQLACCHLAPLLLSASILPGYSLQSLVVHYFAKHYSLFEICALLVKESPGPAMCRYVKNPSLPKPFAYSGITFL